MYLCEVESWDLVIFNSFYPRRIIRVERDDKYIDKLVPALFRFNQELHEAKEKLGVETPAPIEWESGVEEERPELDLSVIYTTGGA